jgi:hypothetical protein
MVRWLVLAVASVPLLSGCISGCSEATGAVHGGEPLLVSDAADPCDPNTEPTWTNLYGCYFGPGKKASCNGLSACHSSSSDQGVTLQLTQSPVFCPAFVCGSKDSCYEGFVHFDIGCADPDAGEAGSGDAEAAEAAAVDAGDVSDAGDAGDGAFDPTKGAANTKSWLRHVISTPKGPKVLNEMPCTGAPLAPGHGGVIQPNCDLSNGYTFTDADLDRIQAWIDAGAPNN